MQVGDCGNLGASRVDDQNLALRVFLDLVNQIARVAETVSEPGIAAKDNEQITMLDIFRGMCILCTEHMPVDPKVASLFLRERTVIIVRTHRPHQRHAIGTTKVVALPTATIKGKAIASIGCANVLELLSDFG